MMRREVEENIVEKLRLIVLEQLSVLDQDFNAMLTLHASQGLLRSGRTIKKTMELIADSNSNYYQKALEHLSNLKIDFYPRLESDLQQIVEVSQKAFKQKSLPFLKKSTDLSRPELYERMLPEVEAGMASDLANFQNSLNALVVQLQLSSRMPLKGKKTLWLVELGLLLVTIAIAVLWYKNPAGNYEPIVVILTLVLFLLPILFGKKSSK